MTFVTPEFTPVFRATVRSRQPGKRPGHVLMRFEVAADSVGHAEAKVQALLQDRHHVIANQGYEIRAKRVQRNNQEAQVLV